MTNLRDLQDDLHEWRNHNFLAQSWEDQFMGMVEEMGELAHALLKQKQGIRGTHQEHEHAAQDAVADLTIYMMGLCSYRGWDFTNLVASTAIKVMRRDWITYPKNGVSE